MGTEINSRTLNRRERALPFNDHAVHLLTRYVPKVSVDRSLLGRRVVVVSADLTARAPLRSSPGPCMGSLHVVHEPHAYRRKQAPAPPPSSRYASAPMMAYLGNWAQMATDGRRSKNASRPLSPQVGELSPRFIEESTKITPVY